MDKDKDSSPRDKRSSHVSEEPIISSQRKPKLHKVKEGIKKLPEKKAHLDFLAALLTIPVLITVLFLNLNNLRSKPSAIQPSPSLTTEPTVIYKQAGGNITPVVITSKPQPTIDQNQCTKDIGPISIASPNEGDTITSNPVCIGINYQQGNYCPVVWAYQINGSSLSDYSNNSVCLYNLPQGQNTFTLYVKSLSSNSTQTLVRHFIYKNSSVSITPSTTPTPIMSSTPSISPTVTQ